MKSISKIDLYLTQAINQFTCSNRTISLIMRYITHTSGGRIYILYFLVIPFLPAVTGGAVSNEMATFTWVYGGAAFIFFQRPAYFLIKNTFRRERPSTDQGVHPVAVPPDRFSFPSGHSASATFLYLIVIQQGSTFAPYFAAWMAVILISRVGLGLHYLSDVLGGISLGTATFCVTLYISSLELNISHVAYNFLSSIIN